MSPILKCRAPQVIELIRINILKQKELVIFKSFNTLLSLYFLILFTIHYFLFLLYSDQYYNIGQIL